MAELAERLTTEQRLERRLRDLSDEQESETKTDNNYSDSDKTKLNELPDNQSLESKLDGKVDKVEGKELSSNDFTDEKQTKLNEIEEEANSYILTYLEANDNEINLGSQYGFEANLYLAR